MSYCPIMKWTLNLMKLMLFRRVSCRKNQFSSILEKRQSVYYMSKNRENRKKRKNRYCEQNSLLFSSAILKYYTKSLVVSNWWGEEEQWAKRDWDLLGPPTRVLKGSKWHKIGRNEQYSSFFLFCATLVLHWLKSCCHYVWEKKYSRIMRAWYPGEPPQASKGSKIAKVEMSNTLFFFYL